MGLQPHEREMLLSSSSTCFGAVPVTLGPRMLLASHCIVLAHAGMDAAEEESLI